ncbi:hypothetical protein LguiA_007788 [Lonicera macranthoides]
MAVLVPMPSNSTPITWLVANSFLFDRRIIRCIFTLFSRPLGPIVSFLLHTLEEPPRPAPRLPRPFPRCALLPHG